MRDSGTLYNMSELVTPRLPGINFKVFIFIIRDLLDELAAPTRPVEMDMGTWFMKPTRRVEGMHENPNF